MVWIWDTSLQHRRFIRRPQWHEKSHRSCVNVQERGIVLTFKQAAGHLTSSTVAESIGLDDPMNFVMWVKLFIEQQVANLPTKSIIKKLIAQPSMLQQDNTSSIRLETNGKRSSTKRTRHINIR